MILKKIFLLIMFSLILTISAHSQTFTEITEFGWGHGIARVGQTFKDIDNDGLLDVILLGFNYNFIHLEQNSVNSTSFHYVSNSALNELDTPSGTQQPFFIDIDNDNLLDMFLGTNSSWVSESGYVFHYEQSSINSYDFTLVSTNFMGFKEYSCLTPTIIDIDGDGLLDMIHYVTEYEEYWPGQGEYNYYYKHYEQASTNSYLFNLITEEFIDLNSHYFFTPTFSDIDNDNLLDMFIGHWSGGIYHYEQDEVNAYSFSLISQAFNNIDLDIGLSPSFIDSDSNNLIELILFVGSKDIVRYEQNSNNSYVFVTSDNIQTDIIDVGSGSTITIEEIDNNGLIDILIGEVSYNNGVMANVTHYEQTNTNSLNFACVSDSISNVFGSNEAIPTIIDIDSNGLFDLFIGQMNNNIKHYEQTSNEIIAFDLQNTIFDSLSAGAATSFIDLDGDNLLDLLIGNFSGNIKHYEQTTSNPFDFVIVSTTFNNIDVGSRSKPFVSDFDNNGLLDLFIGEESGNVNYYEQVSPYSYDFTLVTNNFLQIDVGYNSAPFFYDLNGDDLEDLIVGSVDGGLYLYIQNPVSVDEDFVSAPLIILNQNYPNPFNPSTTIEFSIQNDSKVELTIFNIKGQKVKTLAQNEFTKGLHSIVWCGDDELGKPVSSGVYLYKLKVNSKTESVKKCILIK